MRELPSPSLLLTSIVSTHPTNLQVPRLGFQPADQIIKTHFQNTKAFNTTSASHNPRQMRDR
jgi:hypothetical protein